MTCSPALLGLCVHLSPANNPALLATTEVWNLVAQSGPVAKIVLVLLLGFSILSWSIILSKGTKFRRMRSQSGRFLRAYRKAGGRLQDVSSVSEQFKPSPLVAVFEGGFDEYRRQAGAGSRSLAAVQRATQIASSEEMTQMESRLPWLATTGAVTPFVGLFGTVWGIIDAFQGLGNAGAATLRAVAPGISEALITTAAGLFTAIPAVIAYNQYMQQIREFGARMDDFALEFVNTIERPAPQQPPARTRESVVLEER
ncbi:MAG: MotA/TolQ/ExbB proton channel family protein [Acidobacteria bacterium]|nr:MotA/TolQ/ExbB proton channel family protein [Acidobacteriota bacterium]